MNKPRVYVPQVPSRLDPVLRDWVPTVNLKPAEAHGEVIVLLPPQASRMATAPLVVALREQMAGFTEGDYLVAVGDPSILAAAACIAARKTGGVLRILKWDRQTSTYIPVEMNV